MRIRSITKLLILMMLMAACVPAATSRAPNTIVVPAVTNKPAATATPTEVPVSAKLSPAPFEAETYINMEFGFALDYPARWMVHENIVNDPPQIQFFSSTELIESAVLPEGASRVTAVIDDWEPKNDLPAYVANWKTAWESSGLTIVEEQPLVLDLGLNAVLFKLKTPDSSAVILITALGDKYMILSGEGDLELAKEILQRLRPISVK